MGHFFQLAITEVKNRHKLSVSVVKSSRHIYHLLESEQANDRSG